MKTILRSFAKLLIMLAASQALPAAAQKGLPNPLIQPPSRMAPSAEGGAQEGGGAAPQAAPAGAPKDVAKALDDVPADLMGRVSALYVSAIVGDVAVLRAGSAATGGGAGSGGSSAGGAAPAAAAGRAVVYYVRDAEPFQIFDRFRLLPKVQDTTVVLYLMPDAHSDPSKRPQVVFRASLDSLNTTPHVPSKLDSAGEAGPYQGLIQTGAGGSSGGGKSGGAGGGPK
jgi:hypothetical protein